MGDIVPNEIVKGDYIKVLIEDENEYFASVLSNEGNNYLFVSYLLPIGKAYKSALVYSFEKKAERVDFESIMEHYNDGEGFAMKKVGKNMYVFVDNIDPESDSEIEDIEDHEESEDDSFVVSDTEEMCDLPPDAKELDEAWNQWSPTTPSAKRFKQKIDQIESAVKIESDEKKNMCE
jgi:hypothetical protein